MINSTNEYGLNIKAVDIGELAGGAVTLFFKLHMRRKNTLKYEIHIADNT